MQGLCCDPEPVEVSWCRAQREVCKALAEPHHQEGNWQLMGWWRAVPGPAGVLGRQSTTGRGCR